MLAWLPQILAELDEPNVADYRTLETMQLNTWRKLTNAPSQWRNQD